MKLEIGYNHSFEIRREICLTNCKDNFSVLYLSDLHLNKFSQSMTTKIVETIDELNPTIILFGGDYVDSQKGLVYFNNLLGSISDRKNVFAIAGNHDHYFGLDKIEQIISDNNVAWLENKSIQINFKNTTLKIDGNFISKEKSNTDFSILLLHKPVYTSQFENNYHLAFAGHLHGSQFVLWQSGNKLFPGKFFYKWNILKAELTNCYYYISKGLGDTLPIRYNCKKDLLFIEVTGNN